ncbi:LGFP repeat protein [Corynebacterium auriscanis]|nr:LGFP repeat protein [Corynebacterium auriscanis]
MLSYPIEDETSIPDGIGKFSKFVWGFIYWSPATGARPIYGPVLFEWANSGFEKGKYGYPTADIKATKDGGDLQYFQRGLIRSPRTYLKIRYNIYS